MDTIFGNSNVELCKEVDKLDTPKTASNRISKKNISVFRFTYLENYFTDWKSQGIKI